MPRSDNRDLIGEPIADVQGRPGSGKTSLMRRVMQVLSALPEQKRVITVEDVEELLPAVDN